jgi:hypothetical protein
MKMKTIMKRGLMCLIEIKTAIIDTFCLLSQFQPALKKRKLGYTDFKNRNS